MNSQLRTARTSGTPAAAVNGRCAGVWTARGAVVLLVAVAIGACRGPAPASRTVPASTGTALAHPHDPLPPPLPMPAGSPDEAAAGLAERILSGTPESLPALLAALQAAGVAVRGPDGHLAVQPADGGQGLAVSAWEARFMAALTRKDRALLVPLTKLQEVLVRAAPELRGIPIAQHILDGIRAHAEGQHPAMRAWARLIAELGRQRQVGGPQDLLGGVGPEAVRLDAVQLSLVTLRLIGDLEAIQRRASVPRGDVVADAGQRPRRASTPAGWLAPPAAFAAAAPCADDDPVISREQVSASGFDVLRQKFRDVLRGMAPERLRRAVRSQRAYQTLALVLAALRIEVAMEPPGPPLVRTKTTDPGEERTIRARVYLDPKTMAWSECARAVLEALGLRLNVGSPAAGGVAGVPVTWRLAAGEDTLLLQCCGDDNTDPDGASAYAVLGKPQDRPLPDTAQRVSKQGAVAVGFDLRPYALLGGQAPSDPSLPEGWLQEASFRYETIYPFEVVDWESGGPWTGTITYTRTERHQRSEGFIEEQGQSTLRIVVDLGDTNSEAGDPATGVYVAQVRATARGEYSKQARSQGWKWDTCAGRRVRLDWTTEDRVIGSGSGRARVIIQLTPGNYSVAVSSEESFEAEGRLVGRQAICEGGGRVSYMSRERGGVRLSTTLGIPVTIASHLKSRDALRGTWDRTVESGPVNNRATVTETLEWDLRRR